MKIKSPIIKLIMSCLCLGSTYAIASPPLPDNSKIQASHISEKYRVQYYLYKNKILICLRMPHNVS